MREHKALIAATQRPTRTVAEIVGKIAAIVHCRSYIPEPPMDDGYDCDSDTERAEELEDLENERRVDAYLEEKGDAILSESSAKSHLQSR